MVFGIQHLSHDDAVFPRSVGRTFVWSPAACVFGSGSFGTGTVCCAGGLFSKPLLLRDGYFQDRRRVLPISLNEMVRVDELCRVLGFEPDCDPGPGVSGDPVRMMMTAVHT